MSTHTYLASGDRVILREFNYRDDDGKIHHDVFFVVGVHDDRITVQDVVDGDILKDIPTRLVLGKVFR